MTTATLAAEACDCAVPMPSTGLGTPVVMAGTTVVLIVVPLLLHWFRSRRAGTDEGTDEAQVLIDEVPDR
jgi:hypothetical protein